MTRYPLLALACAALAACSRAPDARATDSTAAAIASPSPSGRPPASARPESAAAPAPDSFPGAQPADDFAAVVRAHFDTLRAGDTTYADMRVGTAGRVEGAAGSRYVDVPVTAELRVRGRQPVRRSGTVTLRRVVVPGASAAQQRWHVERVVWEG